MSTSSNGDREIEAEFVRPGPQDRRAHPRIDMNLRVLLVGERFATGGETMNISIGGAFIRATAPLRLGARYDFFLENEGEKRRGCAKVLRELPGYVYAVQFEEPIQVDDIQPGAE